MADTADIIVLGSGAGGLSAAVTAAARGLRVLVLEKDAVLGGTTAWSGGWIWAPGNHHGAQAGIKEPEGAPRRYLEAVVGRHFDAARVDAFLAAAPEMVAFFEAETALAFQGGFAIPDTYGHQPGAGVAGRSVIAAPYDARGLGSAIDLLRKPLRETTFLGMTIQAGPDLRAFMTMTRSLQALRHATGRVLRHMRDLALHGRGMDLRNGNALAARLIRSALDLGVDLRTGVTVTALNIDSAGAVHGVVLRDGTVLRARCAVVLACGGAPHPAARADSLALGAAHRSLAVPGAVGDGMSLARGAGAALGTNTRQPAALCPVSEVPWPDGRRGLFPHIIERGKPGVIGVLANGRRFCNEGLGYHDYVEALLAAVPEGTPAESWLICDHRFLRRFGLGVVRPQPLPWRGWLRRGYLRMGRTPAELALACGIDQEGLVQTLNSWNSAAEQGQDPAFGRGTSAYMRLQGDPEQSPNPCVAPIRKAPFFAVKVVPGSFGTFAGLSTDAQARVLDDRARVIPGLYAAGTDAASVFGGFYPAGGINLGPALTFGFIAGRYIAQTHGTAPATGKTTP